MGWKWLFLIFILLFLISCSKEKEQSIIGVENMKLTSSAFQNNGSIPSKYTCDGDNINPPLKISGVPAKAKSLVLIMDDPDAVKPAGKVWDHWIVWNIPSDTAEIKEGEEPEGMYGKGTGGNLNYRGPCPPDAEHRYFFKLYAIDITLDLPEGSTKAEVEKEIKEHIIEKTELIGRYSRQ